MDNQSIPEIQYWSGYGKDGSIRTIGVFLYHSYSNSTISVYKIPKSYLTIYSFWRCIKKTDYVYKNDKCMILIIPRTF